MKNLVLKKYKILDHPADLKIKAYGKNLEELFNNILLAMAEAMEPVSISEEISRGVDIKSRNLESLLIDFLSDVIYETDLNNAVFKKLEVSKLTDQELEGKISGPKIKNFKTEIKAVTWHDLEIKKINSLWQATVVFDI